MCNTARAKTYISTHICCSLRLSWENRSDFELAGEQLFRNTSQQQLRSLLVQHRDGLCIRAGIKPPHHSPALLSLSFHIPQWVPLNKHFLPGRHLLLSYSLRNGIIIIIKKSSSSKKQTWWKRKANCQTASFRAALHVGVLAKTRRRHCSASQHVLAPKGLRQYNPSLLQKHYSGKKELQMIFLGKSSSLE